MDDGGVGHRGGVADVEFALEDEDVEFVTGEIAGEESADGPRTDDDDIFHNCVHYTCAFVLS